MGNGVLFLAGLALGFLISAWFWWLANWARRDPRFTTSADPFSGWLVRLGPWRSRQWVVASFGACFDVTLDEIDPDNPDDYALWLQRIQKVSATTLAKRLSGQLAEHIINTGGFKVTEPAPGARRLEARVRVLQELPR